MPKRVNKGVHLTTLVFLRVVQHATSRAHGAGALIEKKAPPCSGGGLGTTLGIKRLENDSTLGRPQSENANIGWAWPFQIVIHFNGTLHHTTKFQAIVWIPCISTMGHLPGPSLPRKILKFRRTSKNWPSMAMLNNGLLHGTVYHSAKFQADSWNP